MTSRRIEFTGKTFGKLRVVKIIENNKICRKVKYSCVCDCGKEIILSHHVIHKGKNNCGCESIVGENSKKDITGQQFNSLKVLSFSKQEGTTRFWNCECICGRTLEITQVGILRGNRKSCGCLNIGSTSSQWRGHGEISGQSFSQIKNNAKARNLEFDITIEDIWNVFLKQNRKCALSGIDLKFSLSRIKTDTTASLDRIDSLKGYTIDNIQWVHKDINFMKQEYNQEYFVGMCHKISKIFSELPKEEKIKYKERLEKQDTSIFTDPVKSYLYKQLCMEDEC